MNELDHDLITYYLRIMESFSLYDRGEVAARDVVLEELDALWLDMDAEGRSMSKRLAKKARHDYELMRGGVIDSSVYGIGASQGSAPSPSFWEAEPFMRPSTVSSDRSWARRGRGPSRGVSVSRSTSLNKGLGER